MGSKKVLSKPANGERELRARLTLSGASALSDAELIGILIREGTNGNSPTQTAERLLASCGDSLTYLADTGILQLRQSESLGMTKATTLAVSFELARRIARAGKSEPTIIRTSEDIEAIFTPLLSHLKHEEMWIAYLTSGNKIIERRRVGQGGITSLVTDLKIILKRAVELLATSIIAVHNHPSGLADPSGEDIEFTKRLFQAAALLDVVLLDHLILAENGGVYSFRKNGLI